ncbi:hypothetical protein J6590_052825 [Homalodisca vitripennis]|nr:hypothetical protein J6590_052825 [Homalodisca vitripennis]
METLCRILANCIMDKCLESGDPQYLHPSTCLPARTHHYKHLYLVLYQPQRRYAETSLNHRTLSQFISLGQQQGGGGG